MNNDDLEVRFSKGLVDRICCSVSLEPFKKAHMVNCPGDHSFSLDSITSMFGNLELGKCEKPGPCPLCRGRVTKCRPNPALQDIVDEILGVERGQAHIDTMYAMLRKLKAEFDAGGRYPLPKTEFVLKEKSSYSKDYIEVGFDNKNRNLKEVNRIATMSFSIQQNKRYSVYVYFHDNDSESKHKLLEYMRKNNVNSFKIMDDSQGLKIFYSDNKSEFIACIRLLMLANDFDEGARTELTKLLEYVDKLNG